MKNVKEFQKKTCLVFDFDELSIILSELFDDAVNVVKTDFEFYVVFDRYEPDVWYDEVIKKLSEYFGVEITSIHIDQCDYPLVWICYKEV